MKLSKKIIAAVLVAALTSSAQLFSIVGAGVLPYAINPKDKHVYFLFSREAFGPDKGTWSDFGGKASSSDHNNPKRVASRECAEESIGLFGSHSKIERFLSKKYSNTYHIDKNYVLYFAPVAYKNTIAKNFTIMRNKTTKIHSREKDVVTWVRADILLKALRSNNNRLYVHNKPLQLRNCTFNLLSRHGQSIISKLNQKNLPYGPLLR